MRWVAGVGEERGNPEWKRGRKFTLRKQRMGPPHGALPHGHRKKKTSNAQFPTTILYKASVTVLTKFSHRSLATEQIIKYKLTSKNNTHTHTQYTLYSKQWPRCHFYCLEVPKQRSASLFFHIRLHHRSSHNLMLYP